MTSPNDPFAAPPRAYGPPPGYAPPSGYGPPPLPGQVPPPYGSPQTSGTAIAALVLAVGSFVVFPIVPAIIALVLARSASQDIRVSGGRLTGDGLVTAARWTAWINLVLSLGAILLVVLVLVLFGAVAVSP